MYISYGTQQSMVILPSFNVAGHTPSDLQVSFAYAGSNGTIGHAIYVGVLTSPADLTSFTILDTVYITETNTFKMANEISFANYTGDGRLIAFLVDYFTIENGGTLYLDDIRVELIPSCKRPLDVTINALADTQVDFSWTPRATEQSWEIAYGNVGFDIDNAQYITVNQPNYQLTGLSPLSAYQHFVRGNCGNTDASAWSAPIVCSTTKQPDQVALSIDFESSVDNSKWTHCYCDNTNERNRLTEPVMRGQLVRL